MLTFLKRMLTFTIAFLLFIIIYFLILYLIGANENYDSFPEYLLSYAEPKLLGFYLLLVVIYPLVGFVNQKRHLNKDYSHNKEIVEKVFEQLGYEKTKENNDKVFFRKRTTVGRLALMFMDTVIVDKSENPIKIDGVRKEVKRINKELDTQLLDESE